jgi:hypothetical protein
MVCTCGSRTRNLQDYSILSNKNGILTDIVHPDSRYHTRTAVIRSSIKVSRSKLVTTSTRVAEMVSLFVVEIVPVRDAPPPVVEMIPVLVVEIVPALVVEMVPVFANVVAATAITNIDAQRIVLNLFIGFLLRKL